MMDVPRISMVTWEYHTTHGILRILVAALLTMFSKNEAYTTVVKGADDRVFSNSNSDRFLLLRQMFMLNCLPGRQVEFLVFTTVNLLLTAPQTRESVCVCVPKNSNNDNT